MLPCETLDDVAQSIDYLVDTHRRGIISPCEAIESVASVAGGLRRWTVVDDSDLALALDYARCIVSEISDAERDPLLIEYFEERLRGEGLREEASARLALYLECVANRLQSENTTDALSDLIDLCGDGYHTHPILLYGDDAASVILRFAYEMQAVEALLASVHPGRCAGQIAEKARRPRHFRMAMNYLAHLAASPEEGGSAAVAVAGLLELAAIPFTAGEAAIRLPVHRLGDADRRQLLEILETRESLFSNDPILIPLPVEILRDNRIMISSVGLAHDARHVL